MEGAAASINSVANFITALKRSGYFTKIEIKESKQDEKNTAVQTFLFSINAEIAPNGSGRRRHRKPSRPARRHRPCRMLRHRRRKDNEEPWQILSEICR